MIPQPLYFITSDQQQPVEVNLFEWGRLGTKSLWEVRLTGTIDLSTVERVHYFNGLLMRA